MSNLEKTDKTQWMEEFQKDRPDLFFPESWSSDKKERAMKKLKQHSPRRNIFTSIPIKCKGPECPYAETCPLQQDDVAPIGSTCPLEAQLVSTLMTELIEEFRVDQDSINEIAMIRDLVNQEIQHVRITNLLSQENFIKEVFAGFNERTGEVYMKDELHKAIDFEDKILKRKKELRNQFLATREAKAKAGIGHMDSSNVVSTLIHGVEEVRLQREKAMREKLGMSGVDQYILDSTAEESEDGDDHSKDSF